MTDFVGFLEGVHNNPILNYPYQAEEQMSLARSHRCWHKIITDPRPKMWMTV